MALTRAQLLAGNSSQGIVLAGQPQGVVPGSGISIDPSGQITVDASTVVGLMRLNNGSAANTYQWPATIGAVGTQLGITGSSGGLTTLGWVDPDGIPWTAKGELVVGTGSNTQTLLTAGANGSVLIADSAAASGLSYTSNFVSTVGPTAAAIIPAGVDGLRPAAPVAGYFRYNATSTKMEFYNGSSWQQIASAGSVPSVIGTVTSVDVSGGTTGLTFTGGPVTTFGTVTLGGVLGIANGGTGQTTQAGAQAALFPTQAGQAGNFLTTDGTNISWAPAGGGTTYTFGLGLNLTGALAKVSIPVAATPPTAGAAANQAIDGSLYWDDTLTQLFIRYNNGGTPIWVAASPAAGSSGPSAATLAQSAAGTLTTVYNSPETSVPKDSAGMGGAAIIPSGVASATTANGAGKFRYYTDKTGWFGNTGSAWVPFDQRQPVVTATSTTATANGYVVVTAGSQTITLPASPVAGQVVTIVVAGTFTNTVVARNGNNIMGLAEDLTLNIANASLQFTYTGNATQGWRIN